MDIVKAAIKALNLIYQPGHKIIKVEVLVTGIIPQLEVQLDLFNSWDGNRQDKLSKLMDKLNTQYGRRTLWILIACQGNCSYRGALYVTFGRLIFFSYSNSNFYLGILYFQIFQIFYQKLHLMKNHI